MRNGRTVRLAEVRGPAELEWSLVRGDREALVLVVGPLVASLRVGDA